MDELNERLYTRYLSEEIMLRFSILLFLPLLSTVTAQYVPLVGCTCGVGPSYSFTVFGASPTGVIFINGACAALSTSSAGPYMFSIDDCPGIPVLGSTFKVVVRKYANMNLEVDYILQVTCNLDLSDIVKVLSVGTVGEDYDGAQTSTITPSITVEFRDEMGASVITSGDIGMRSMVVFSMSVAQSEVFDYQIIDLVASTTDGSVDMIVDGCTGYADVIAQPGLPSGGKLTVNFNLFIPHDATSLPGTGSTAVTFTFTIDVCESSCTEPTCGDPLRRKRSTSSTNSTHMPVELAASLIVYPAGHKTSVTGQIGDEVVVVDDEVCLSRGPLIGLLAGLCITLALCMAISSWMFSRLRRANNKGGAPDFQKHRY